MMTSIDKPFRYYLVKCLLVIKEFNIRVYVYRDIINLAVYDPILSTKS